MGKKRNNGGKKKSYCSKFSILKPYFFGNCQHSLMEEEECFEWFEDLALGKLSKNLEKWTEALNSDSVIPRYCTGCFRSFILWMILLCPLEKFPGILAIKKDYLWFVILCMAQCRYQIMYL